MSGLVKRIWEEPGNFTQGSRRWSPYTKRALSAPEHSVAISSGKIFGLGRDLPIEKGGYDFLLSRTNLNLLRSQGRFLVQYNKDTFRITASFSERVSYVNAASEKFPSA